MKKTVHQLEKIFTEICQTCSHFEWDENHISFQLMQKLHALFNNRTIHFQRWSKIVDWQSFKNSRKQEPNYGDIALLVHVQFSSGEMLKGVASVETKKNFGLGNFESVDIHQLQLMLQNLPNAQLLLYHQWKQTQYIKFPNDATWHTHFWVSPINTSLQLLKQLPVTDNGRLIRTGCPFAMFLTSRIFWGLDLDFRDEIYDDLLQGTNQLTNPSFLGFINVYHNDQTLVRLTPADNWEEI